MRNWRDITIGIRTQAVIVFALTALWYLAIWLGFRSGKGFVANLNLFWNAVALVCPFLAVLFAGNLWVAHLQGDRTHWAWTYAALLVAATPWMLFFLAVLLLSWLS